MGIQISGLLSGQAFDWKSVVDQLIAADSVPITNLQTQKTTNSTKVTALADINTSLQALQDAAQSIRAGNIFTSRAVSSDNPTSSWKSASSAGAQVGTYKIAVSQLATAASIAGTTDIGQGIAPTSDVSGVTLSTMNTAVAVTAGVITVAGKQITIDPTTESLQQVFTDIFNATGNTVTGSYTPSASPNDGGDKVTLTSSSGELILGAANDTSNFLQVLKLANNGTSSTTSTSALGIVKTSATLANSGLRTPAPGDGSGNGSFVINGKTINYNINTDSSASVISSINSSQAGVTASYDPSSDSMKLTNNTTGDTGIAVNDTSGLLASLGLAAGTFTHGKNAQFTINGGATLTSSSNTLDSSVHGITGFSVTVNSQTTETITVASDVGTMQTSIQNLLDKFNAVQDAIESKTKITIGGGNVSTSVLSDNHEVGNWAQQLQDLAFNQVTGITGSITHLDDLGIDFDGTTGHLVIKDQAKLANALDNNPGDVQSYFVSGANGLVPSLYSTMTNLMANDVSQQSDLNQANTAIDNQISTLQARLDEERSQLTSSFIAMLDAQSNAQSQNTSLTNQFFNNNNSCWVARAVYGATDPRWMLFRFWLLFRAPACVRWTYLRYGERFAAWVAGKPRVKNLVRRWMDARIAGLWSA